MDLISRAAHAVPPITLMVSIEMFTMIIRSDLCSVHVPSPPVPFHQEDVPSDSKRKVTDEEVFHFFRWNSQASNMDTSEMVPVTRQTIRRKVSRLIEEGKMERGENGLVVTTDPG